MFFKLVLKGFKLKKLVIEPKMVQPVEPDKEPIERQLNRQRLGSTPYSTSRGCKNFIFLPERLFNRLRSGQGSTITYQVLNANGQSTDRTPNDQFDIFSSIKRLKSSLFHKFNFPKPFLNIFEPWKSVFEWTIVLKLAYPQCTFQSQFSCII